jgi:hypothetical protein
LASELEQEAERLAQQNRTRTGALRFKAG